MLSQPGIDSLLTDGRHRKQRAVVGGFMLAEMANYVLSNLNVDNVIIRTPPAFANKGLISRKNTEFNDKCKLGSVTFTVPDVPDANYMYLGIDPKYQASMDLSYPLSRDYQWLKKYSYPNLKPVDIVEIHIFDVRWNDNSTLWTSLLNILTNYTDRREGNQMNK